MDFIEKSRAVSFFSTLVLGPLGLVYASPIAGLLLMLIAMVVYSAVSDAVAVGICWFLAIVIGDHIVHKHNLSIEILKRLLARN